MSSYGKSMVTPHLNPVFREAQVEDLKELVALENASFETDRLSKRQFKYWLNSDHCVFTVVEQAGMLMGYGLVIMRKGTRLARLYSIAVSKSARGLGLGKQLLQHLEQQTAALNKLFLRLEVAKNNTVAISMYESMGYRIFGTYQNYYADHSDAYRMQKAIRNPNRIQFLPAYPWYEQTTDFTCGPSSLMMAMAQFRPDLELNQELELDIWREATTIFMTSGHGGCHPVGLALAAIKRGFHAEVYINQEIPLFTNGVRSPFKKEILELVERQFLSKAERARLTIHYQDFSLDDLAQSFNEGSCVLSLISTYQLNGNKVPHWVTVTGMDSACLYLHDPDTDDQKLTPFECQHLPIALDDFYKLSSYGKAKLRTAIVINQLSA
ncbi:GNAT family N-acetyltransferase/peptidase C39 family protein [Paraneptunicella aestuarii]|uniref:GNAT family N-acetyltransferase/peptidase C39 family protein n=1 Tax=Paraneptunicella aestuarii TaxID=2831148 RepID=UPI001E38FE31|nr:GNAT family N-acetyltransferase/peptidase C39 family protein [Paraneptunicella aestuarii]